MARLLGVSPITLRRRRTEFEMPLALLPQEITEAQFQLCCLLKPRGKLSNVSNHQWHHAQRYTCQLFLSQMHEIFVSILPEFQKNFRRLPNIAEDIPMTSRDCRMSRCKARNLGAILTAYIISPSRGKA